MTTPVRLLSGRTIIIAPDMHPGDWLMAATDYVHDRRNLPASRVATWLPYIRETFLLRVFDWMAANLQMDDKALRPLVDAPALPPDFELSVVAALELRAVLFQINARARGSLRRLQEQSPHAKAFLEHWNDG